MVKSDIISKVAESTGVTKKTAGEIVNATFATIAASLAEGEKVAIADFGIFDIVQRSARECRNPQTNEKMQVPAKKAVKFKASSGIKQSVAKL